MIKKILLSLLGISLVVLIVVVSIANNYQAQNLTQLKEQNIDGRIIPHKVNYKNKLKNVLSDNLKSFEFDSIFNEKVKTPFFEVGHDSKETKGTSFEDYLKITKNTRIKKIWIDVKNLNSKNAKMMLSRLNYLDNIYKIKNILIFETSSSTPMLRLISNAGYHTSYYLPTTALELIQNNDEKGILKEVNRIKSQIQMQNLKHSHLQHHSTLL